MWSEWASHFNGGESAIHKMENNHYQRCKGCNQSKNIHSTFSDSFPGLMTPVQMCDWGKGGEGGVEWEIF